MVRIKMTLNRHDRGSLKLFLYSLASISLATILLSRRRSISLPLNHLDGAYQTVASVTRLFYGDLYIINFQSYIGLGPTLLVAFLSLFSEGPKVIKIFDASYTATTWTGLFFTAYFIHAWRGKLNFKTVFATATTFFVVWALLGTHAESFWRLTLGHESLIFVTHPGNSLRLVRSLGLLLAFLVLSQFSCPKDRSPALPLSTMLRKSIALGALSTLAITWSPEYGVLSLVVLLAGGAFRFRNEFVTGRLFRRIRKPRTSAVKGTSVPTSGQRLGSIIELQPQLCPTTKNWPFKSLRYLRRRLEFRHWLVITVTCVLMLWLIVQTYFFYFAAVGKDQWWYFGPYFESVRILSINDLIKELHRHLDPTTISFLVFIVGFTFRFRRVRLWVLGPITGFFLAGVVSTVGGHREGVGYFGYFASFHLAVRLCTIGLAVSLSMRIAQNVFGLKRWHSLLAHSKLSKIYDAKSSHRLAKPVSSLMLLFSILAIALPISSSHVLIAEAESPDSYLSSGLPEEFLLYNHLIHSQDDPVLFEEYSGFLSAINPQFVARSVDSVIHALGPLRSSAKNELDVATFATSTSPNLSPYWLSWNISVNWWFYMELFEHFTLIESGQYLDLWQRTYFDRVPRVADAQRANTCTVVANSILLADLPNYPTLLNVEVQFETNTLPSRPNLAFIRNNINLVEPSGYVVIPPHDTTFAFPVFSNGAKSLELDILQSEGLEKIVVNACKFDSVDGSETILDHYSGLFGTPVSPAQWTDENWECGVGRNFSGIFVYRTPGAIAFFDQRNTLTLVNGQTLNIARIESVDGFINVFFSEEIKFEGLAPCSGPWWPSD